MRRIAKNVHFSDWAKVREGLIARDVTDITANSTDEEVRTFLENTSSEVNPFYYDIVYIKSTKEIYTHGQFYPGNFYITDFYVDDLINIAGDGAKSIPVGRVFSAVRDRKIIYVPYGLDGGSYGGFIANATSTEDWYSLIIYTRDSIITAYVDKGDDLSNFWGNYVSVEPLLFNSSLKTINGQSIVGTGNITIDVNSDVIQDGSITAEKLADGIANDIISSLSTQSTLPSLTDYYIGQNAGGRTETYFKKTLQSIGSVFQHELYDKVYLKDGSDPTFGNITAGQLNLSENSGVFYAGGVGLALCVNDCAFYVGEEDGVYYIDAAGNTQTMLHSGNIGNYKAGDAGNSDKLGGVEASKYFKGDSTNLISNINADNLVNNACYLNATGNGSGNANFPHTYSIFNVFTNGLDSRVAQVSISEDGLAIRRKIDSWGAWRHYINTDNIGNYNAGSATKLQTPRKLWGQSFDGTSDVNGAITLPNNTPINVKNSAGTSANNALLMTTGDNLYLGYGTAVYNGSDTHIWGKNIKFTNKSGQVIGAFSNDKLGIGVENPSEKLDVAGNVKASGDITANKFIGSIRGNIIYDNGTDEGHFIGLGSNGVGVKGLLNYVYGNFPILFYTNGFERMRIGEYVGIGTTSPSERLDVAGNVKANSFIGNASSATKLATPRKLWGQSFDGTANIDGDITLNGYQDGRQLSIRQSGEIKFSTPSDNGWATSLSIYASDKTTLLTSAFGVHGIREDVQYAFIGGTYDNPNVVVQDDTGYVGIGTTSPSEKLDVTGNVKASGKIQCSNLVTTGTINQTANNSYIVHNAVSNGDHKMWITDGTGKSISAGNAFNLDAINIISDKSLVLGAQLDYNIRVLKANNRIAKVIDSVNYSTLLPYKTPVAISNTYSSNPHNVAMADNTLYIVYENEADDLGCTILSFPTNDGSTPLTCGLLYTTYADSTGEFSCPTVIWSYNITPLMEPEATFEMWFTSYDGGTTWYGTHTVYK